MKTRAQELKEMLNDLGNQIIETSDSKTCRLIDQYVKYQIELAKLQK